MKWIQPDSLSLLHKVLSVFSSKQINTVGRRGDKSLASKSGYCIAHTHWFLLVVHMRLISSPDLRTVIVCHGAFFNVGTCNKVFRYKLQIKQIVKLISDAHAGKNRAS